MKKSIRNPTILNDFGTSENYESKLSCKPLKNISDNAKTYPNGHHSILVKYQNLESLNSGAYMVSMNPRHMIWRHGMCCMDLGDVFLWDKDMWLWEMWIWEMASCWSRIYGCGDVFLVEKNIWIWKIS